MVIFIMLINVEMPTIADILTYVNMINFMLSSVEHEKNKTNSKPYLGPCCFISNYLFFFFFFFKKKKKENMDKWHFYCVHFIVHMKTLISFFI